MAKKQFMTKSNENIDKHYFEMKQLINSFAKDSFNNPTLNKGIGTSDPMNDSFYTVNRGLTWNWTNINRIERSEPILRKIVEYKAFKPLKNGIDINSLKIKPEKLRMIQAKLKKLNKELYKIIYQGEFYGGSAGLICIAGQMTEDELVKPLDYDKINPSSFLGIKTLERWIGIRHDTSSYIEELTDANGIDNPDLLGQPMYFYVRLTPTTTSREIKVHRSRLLIYTTGHLPLIENQIEQFWGVSIVERLWDDLNQYNATLKHLNNMLLIGNQRVVKIDAITGAEKQTSRAREMAKNKLSLMSEGLNSSNILFLSTDDEFEYESANLSNADKIYDKMCVNLASKAGVEYNYLFDDICYNKDVNEEAYASIKTIQEIYIREWYDKLIKIIYKDLFGGRIPTFSFEFKNIKDVDNKEIADVIAKVSEPLMNLYENSAIDKETLVKSLSEISNNVGDVFNNFSEDFIAKFGKETKIEDQVKLAYALNKNQETGIREEMGGDTNEKKPTPRVEIN